MKFLDFSALLKYKEEFEKIKQLFGIHPECICEDLCNQLVLIKKQSLEDHEKKIQDMRSRLAGTEEMVVQLENYLKQESMEHAQTRELLNFLIKHFNHQKNYLKHISILAEKEKDNFLEEHKSNIDEIFQSLSNAKTELSKY